MCVSIGTFFAVEVVMVDQEPYRQDEWGRGVESYDLDDVLCKVSLM